MRTEVNRNEEDCENSRMDNSGKFVGNNVFDCYLSTMR